MMETWMIYAGVALLIVFALLGLRQGSRDQSRQDRLAQAYGRALRVRYAGTGEQGRPYSVYTDYVNRL